MKKLMSLALVLCLLLSLLGAYAESDVAQAAAPAEAAPAQAVPDEAADNDLVQTHHTVQIAGQTIDYTATTGTLAVELEGSTSDMFFTAYTMDGVEDLNERPVTFVFNGGPGSSSEWMHLGMLGPRRVDVDESGRPKELPVKLVDNPYSLLDMTDLVFIDPVGTGYSRATGETDPNVFYTYASDVMSVSKLIRLYVTRNGRWGSPKYLAGESYGTVRAIGVTNYLADAFSMSLNGVILVSSINDFYTSSEFTGSDLSYVLTLPTYAALGQYHGMLAEPYQSMALEDLMDEVRSFAGQGYQEALYKGSRLTGEEKNAVAEQIAGYTGLDAAFVLKHNLRIDVEDFCKQLLSDQKLVIGRIDGRYTGPVTGGSFGSSSADPSLGVLGGAFGMAVNEYIAGELNYHSDKLYETLSISVSESWRYGLDNQVLCQEGDIYNAISQNAFLKIWVLCGYYDLATPFHSAEWVYDHVFLNPENEGRITFTYYPSGHMIYMHEPSLAKFRQEAEAWYK